MGRKLGFIKRLKLYFQYKKIIKKNIKELTKPKYGLRVDYVNRIYTVLTLNDDVKTYGEDLTEKQITNYISTVDKFFSKIGISEYVGIIDIKKETDLDYLIIFGFKFINTPKLANRLIMFIVSIPILLLLLLLFL